MKKNRHFKPTTIAVNTNGLNDFSLGSTILFEIRNLTGRLKFTRYLKACKFKTVFEKIIQRVFQIRVERIFHAVIICFLAFFLLSKSALAQDSTPKKDKTKILYGTASYYSNKFQGRKTANGEIFDQKKITAACNVLPLGTWIRVTNLRNKKSVIVKVNDRLHHKTKRIIDLSKAGAIALNFVKSGLAKVKVEVLGKKKPHK